MPCLLHSAESTAALHGSSHPQDSKLGVWSVQQGRGNCTAHQDSYSTEAPDSGKES